MALNNVTTETSVADILALLQDDKLGLDSEVKAEYGEAYKKAIGEKEATGTPAVKFTTAEEVGSLVLTVNEKEDLARGFITTSGTVGMLELDYWRMISGTKS